MQPQYGHRASAIVLAGLLVYLGGIVASRWEPYTFLFRDGSFYAQTNRAIADGFTLRQEAVQPGSWYDGSLPWYANVDDAWSNISIGTDGEWYPKHSYLMPVFSTPFFLVFGTSGLLLFNLIAMALGLFAVYRIAARASGELPAAISVLGIASCPLIPYLAYSYSHDVFYAALLTGGMSVLMTGRHGFAGILLGLSIFAKVTNAVAVVPIVLFLFRGGRRDFARLAACAAIPVMILAVANWYMYGAPWINSYNRILTVRGGVPEIVSYFGAFGTPLMDGLARYFSSSPEGEIWQKAPLSIVALLGIVPLAFASWRLASGILATVVGYTLLFALYNFGGARFLTPVVMLAVVPGAALIDALGRLAVSTGNLWSAVTRSRAAIRVLLAIGAILLLSLAIRWGSRVIDPGEADSMAADVQRLMVRVDRTPCDYFNMARQKWECSGIDRDDRMYTGTAVANQCAFGRDAMLRIPVAPGGKRRTVEWRPSKGGDHLEIVFGIDGTTKSEGPVTFSIRVGDRQATKWTASTTGGVTHEEVEVPVSPGDPVVLELEPSQKGAALCLDVSVR